MKYLILIFLFFYSCSFIPGIREKDNSPYDFYFSRTDYEFTGRDSTKLCIVDKNHKMFIYTWVWPRSLNPVHRKVQKDEIYLGRGFLKKNIPDSLISGIKFIKLLDSK